MTGRSILNRHRQYMTTTNLFIIIYVENVFLFYMIDLTDQQLQNVCDHLGHTKPVHLGHYRQHSGFIERVNIAKLIQGMNLSGQVSRKKLEDVLLGYSISKQG